MKIYMLLMLMAMFVGFSYAPVRAPAQPRKPTPPDSLASLMPNE